MVDSFKMLWTSRKFLILLLDTIISIVLYFGAKYASPLLFEDMKWFILVMQPIAVAVVYSIAKEDAALAIAASTIGPDGLRDIDKRTMNKLRHYFESRNQ